MICDCIASGHANKPKQHGADPHAKNCAVYLPLVVCDGWTEPRHSRRILKNGNPQHVSHGMCRECSNKMQQQNAATE